MRGEGSYEWDNTTVLYDAESDRFYWEHGSGCSCDGPLEFVHSLDDLSQGTLGDLMLELNSDLDGYKTSEHYGELMMEVARVIEASMRARRERIVNDN